MMIVPLPPPAELERLLGGLLMRAVKVAKYAGEDAPPAPLATALFEARDQQLQVLVRCDLALAAGMAAALSVVPPGVVKECVASKKMDVSLQDNFAEVMNVLSRYVSGGGQRFGLGTVSCPPAAPKPELLAAADASDERREFDVMVPGYGSGRLSLCTL